jgi:hypothetical protein
LAAAFPLSVILALVGGIFVAYMTAFLMPTSRVSFSHIITLFIISIIACLSFSRIGIRVTKLSHDKMTLTGVAPEFVEAVRVWRQDHQAKLGSTTTLHNAAN